MVGLLGASAAPPMRPPLFPMRRISGMSINHPPVSAFDCKLSSIARVKAVAWFPAFPGDFKRRRRRALCSKLLISLVCERPGCRKMIKDLDPTEYRAWSNPDLVLHFPPSLPV